MVRKRFLFFAGIVAVVACCSFLISALKNSRDNSNFPDLDTIRERGKLVALTDFNSTDYFIYKGEPMGFNYEMLKSFAGHIGTDLEIITENNLDKAITLLNSGKVDIVAIGIPVNSARLENVRLSEPVDETRQILVKRRHGKSVSMKTEARRNGIRDQLGLGKNTIYIQTGYSCESLSSFVSSLGDSINVLDVPYEPEKLIQYVAEGIIDYTVCDENVAQVNSTYYPVIDISTHVSSLQKIAWGVRKKNSDALLDELNKWIVSYKQTREYALLYAKYFRNSRSSIIVKSDYYAINTGRISRYDEMIRRLSASIDWDWRLVASLICQESRFNPEVVSHAGAYGLMQVMPVTGKRLGIDVTSSPENNIRAGIKYLDYLHSIFDQKISDEEERINFILAAYNAGPGHVLDAMKLAEKNGMDPHVWKDNVEVWLQKKSEPEYYNDTIVKSGYFRGKESVAFVAQILDRYEHYKNVVPEESIKGSYWK